MGSYVTPLDRIGDRSFLQKEDGGLRLTGDETNVEQKKRKGERRSKEV
jgi:hypothetical protein